MLVTVHAPNHAPASLMPAELTILVIDNDLSILELLREVLTSNRYNVIAASTLADAQAYIKQTHIDLILCDASLPDNRRAAQWAFLGAERHRDLPVIFMTGYAQPPINVRQLLIKPFSVSDLLQLIQSELNSALQCR